MTQEQKDLLLKELCARLPYAVKCKDVTLDFTGIMTDISMHDNMCKLYNDYDNYMCYIINCKPYLFPLSSMTEEQKDEYDKMSELDIEYTITQIKNDSLIWNDSPIWTTGLNRYNWLIKNHFDIYGLIPMGLAIDATGLDIY